ncbi:MAG TPA: hypothetical protein VM577_14870 [Anaerovoracaceae bacterium]|nr:hypothetical protein [Anaerovoracaceae bacterium]
MTPASSADVQWDLDRIETFKILGTEFDVQAAKKLLSVTSRPVSYINTNSLLFISRWVSTFWRIKVKADLSVPIIMASIGGGYLPIDGWHRIHRAIDKKVESIPCVFLTPDETRKIQK